MPDQITVRDVRKAGTITVTIVNPLVATRDVVDVVTATSEQVITVQQASTVHIVQAGVIGPIGAQGPAGPMGTGVVWQGSWSPLTTYNEFDAVSYNGSSYVATGTNLNSLPDALVDWEVLAEEGLPGIQGIQGIQGTQGLTGDTGPQGNDGADGAQGIQGIQGPIGNTGPQGIQGIPGNDGNDGVDGNDGPQGPPGTTLHSGLTDVSPTDNNHISSDENAAVQGTNGTPSNTNRFVTDSDPRNSNARVPTGAAGGVLSGTYPDPSFAVDMATQAELDAHVSDVLDSHDASAVSFDPTGLDIITGTEVQTALEELDQELDAHELDATDAHDASAISSIAAGNLVSTNVQDALNELDTEKTKTPHSHISTGAEGGDTVEPNRFVAVVVSTNLGIGGNVQDHDAGIDTDGTRLIIEQSGPTEVGGFVAPVGNKKIYILVFNKSEHEVTFTCESTASAAGNRFYWRGLDENNVYRLLAGESVWLAYETTEFGLRYVIADNNQLEDHDHSAPATQGGSGLYPASFGSAPIQVALTGTNFHNWNPGGSWNTSGFIIQVTSTNTNPTVITGLVAPSDSKRRLAVLVNKSIMPLHLADQSASSSVGNRFHIAGSLTPYAISPGDSVVLLWLSHGGVNFWIVVSHLRVHSHSSDTDGGSIPVPSQNEKNAMVGTAGVPQTSNKFMTAEDISIPRKIAETVVTGSVAATIDFSSIPATYRHLLLLVQARNDNTTAALRGMDLRFNNDSGANYDTIIWDVVSPTAALTELLAQTSMNLGLTATDLAANVAGYSGNTLIYIPNYAATTFDKVATTTSLAHTVDATGSPRLRQCGGFWRTVGQAINRITLFHGTGNFKIGTTVTLYGLPA